MRSTNTNKAFKNEKKSLRMLILTPCYLWYKIFIQNQTRCMLLEVQKWHWIDSSEENPYLKQFWHSYFRRSWRSFISLPRKISIIWRCSTQLAVACFNETFLTLNFNPMILTFFKKVTKPYYIEHSGNILLLRLFSSTQIISLYSPFYFMIKWNPRELDDA